MAASDTTHDASASDRPPRWFGVVAALGLAWNALGVLAFVAQITISDAALAELPEAEQALHADIPGWVTAAFAVAVFAGVAGCGALLARRRVAMPLFVVSLLAVVVQTSHTVFASEALSVLGGSALVLPATIFVVGGALCALARHANQNGWTT